MAAGRKYPVIDTDVHHMFTSGVGNLAGIAGYLSDHWREYIGYGKDLKPNGNAMYKMPGGGMYPNPRTSIMDSAFLPKGGYPGSDPEFMAKDHLDRYDLEYAVLLPGSTLTLGGITSADFANDIMRATNDWTRKEWLDRDERYLGSILVYPRDPQASAAEIRRLAGDRRFVQVAMNYPPCLMGNRQLWPIYEAANEAGLPVALHPGGSHSGANPGNSAAGFETSFFELHVSISFPAQGHVLSLIAEGVFEKFPRMRVAIVEYGLAWLPFLMWRADMEYRSNRDDVPWLTKLPSDYVHEFFRFTTQPLEIPTVRRAGTGTTGQGRADPERLIQLLSLIDGQDLLMFSSDYPHWDFDNPDFVIKDFPAEWQERILHTNARQFYNLDERLGERKPRRSALAGVSAGDSAGVAGK